MRCIRTKATGNWVNGTEIYDVSVEDLNGDNLDDEGEKEKRKSV